MIRQHTCDWLKEFTTDPRSPIKHNRKSGDYILIVNADTCVVMVYCPRCGEKLRGGAKPVHRREHLCKHLPELSREAKSSVRYRREEREHWLFGSDSLMIRLFHCPICGSKLPLHRNDNRFYKRSPAEVTELTKRFQNVTTIDLALKQFGPPDVDRGPVVQYAYPKGKRTLTGYRRAIFYDHLARTVTVAVIEGLDGHVAVKFYPKGQHKRPA